jgi:hypothetical protein
VQRETVAEESPLPEDVPAAARRLWQAGRERDATGPGVRASVEAMTRRAQVVLVPGATEAHTLRASRQLPAAADREAFARVCACGSRRLCAWPADGEEFEELLAQLAQRFWATGAGHERAVRPAPRHDAHRHVDLLGLVVLGGLAAVVAAHARAGRAP